MDKCTSSSFFENWKSIWSAYSTSWLIKKFIWPIHFIQINWRVLGYLWGSFLLWNLSAGLVLISHSCLFFLKTWEPVSPYSTFKVGEKYTARLRARWSVFPGFSSFALTDSVSIFCQICDCPWCVRRSFHSLWQSELQYFTCYPDLRCQIANDFKHLE